MVRPILETLRYVIHADAGDAGGGYDPHTGQKQEAGGMGTHWPLGNVGII